jgi:hypothetical protein
MPSPTTSTSPSGSKAPAVSSMYRQPARRVPTPSCATKALALHLWPPPLAAPHSHPLHPAAEARILSSPSGAPASSQTLGASRDAGSPTSLATAATPPSGPSLSSSRTASPSRSASMSSPPPQAAYGPQPPSPSHSPSHGALGSLDTTTVHRTDLSSSSGVKLAWQFANGGTVAITASVSQLGWWVGKAVSMPKAHLFGVGAGPLMFVGVRPPWSLPTVCCVTLCLLPHPPIRFAVGVSPSGFMSGSLAVVVTRSAGQVTGTGRSLADTSCSVNQYRISNYEVSGMSVVRWHSPGCALDDVMPEQSNSDSCMLCDDVPCCARNPPATSACFPG